MTAQVFKTFSIGLIVWTVVLAGPVAGGDIVVAGSSLEAPPPFWENSYWGITGSIDRAFPFDVRPDGPYSVDELQVATYHLEGISGTAADFTIHLDDAGIPGDEIARFRVSPITTAQQVLSSVPMDPVVLESDQQYWIVGSTSTGQVNWNLADHVFGIAAYRINNGPWEILEHTNVSAFALLGAPVPEPPSLFLLLLLIPGMGRPRRTGSRDVSAEEPHRYVGPNMTR